MSSSPKKSKSPSGGNIFDRLTDPAKYTGTHVHRFDAEGKGRGLAGRQNIVDFKGNTNTKVVESTAGKSPTRKPVVSPGLGQQKFGTQAMKAPVITLFRNGDKFHSGEVYTVKQVKTLDQLLDKITPIVKLPTGAVRKLYKEGGKSTVKSLDELEDGKRYLACGGEKPAEQDKLPTKWLE